MYGACHPRDKCTRKHRCSDISWHRWNWCCATCCWSRCHTSTLIIFAVNIIHPIVIARPWSWHCYGWLSAASSYVRNARELVSMANHIIKYHKIPFSAKHFHHLYKLSYRRDSARRQLLRHSRSFKVTDISTNRKPVCDYLLVNNAILRHISYLFQLLSSIGEIIAFDKSASRKCTRSR